MAGYAARRNTKRDPSPAATPTSSASRRSTAAAATSPTPFELGAPIDEGRLNWVQRTAGNQAAVDLVTAAGAPRDERGSAIGRLEPGAVGMRPAPTLVQRQPVAAEETPVQVALRTKDPADAKAIKSFAGVSREDRLALVRILAYQAWVGPRDEWKIEEIWGSFSAAELPAVASREIVLWNYCKEVGAELDDLASVTTIRGWFRDDVTGLARQHLDSNRALVLGEMDKAGIPKGAGEEIAPATQDQQGQLDAMRAAAAAVGQVQEQQELARNIVVGYSLRPYMLEAKPYWTPVTFDPFDPPERPDAPVIDPNDPSPMADHHPVLTTVATHPYAPLREAYQQGSQGIRDLVTAFPMLYAISRDASSSATLRFANEADPAKGRQQLAAALQRLLADIDGAKAKLGKELDPLDLLPLHQQLADGAAVPGRKVDWGLQWPQAIATDLVQGHQLKEALIALGLQTVGEMAFMMTAATEGPGMIALLAVGLAAAGIKAEMSNEKYAALQQASKTAVGKDTDLVTPQQVDVAKAQAQADRTALVLAALNTAAGVAGALSSAAGKRLASGAKPGPVAGSSEGGEGSGSRPKGLREVLGAEEYDKRLAACQSRAPAARSAGLSDDELIALDAWSHNDSKEINNSLRGAGSSDRAGLLASLARSGMAKLPTYTGPAKRVQTYVPEGGFTVGMEYTGEGFTAATRGSATPKSITGTVIMKIEAIGTSGHDVSVVMRHQEGEILFAPGTRFRITEARQFGSAWMVTMREM